MTIALILNSGYSISAVKQMTVGFGSLYKQRRTHRPKTLAVFLRLRYALERPLWTGYGLGTYGYADSLCYQSSNQNVRLSTPFGSGRRVKPNKGAYTMANLSISARPEQTQSPIFHLAARAARKSARQWFAGIPTQSLAVWRDTCRLEHCDGLPNPKERGLAFDDAFAREIGNLIIAGGRTNA